MAFFTRPELGAVVPDVGDEDESGELGGVRSESSTLTRGEKLLAEDDQIDGLDESASSDDEAEGAEETTEKAEVSRTVEGRESPANQRFDYVVDRTLGVQV